MHPYPSNNSFYSLLMARVGCVLRFHACHELGYFDYDGFVLLMADDDTRLCYRGGTAYASICLCAGFLVLMAVIKTCETFIPKQLLSYRCSDGFGLDVSHASMAVMTLVFYCLHLASPGKQTRPPLFCSI